MKSALFVDFDNVYSSLRQIDQTSADRFARRPLEWMRWLTESLELPEHSRPGARRRVLVRRCYLNPQAYQRFRPSFNLAGFEIVDCPALTSEGKTSTDIHMVLDIVDLLQHEAHYDEFIVFSADADFTPVLRRLRRWDRRTTVLAIGFPSAAYRASADLLIDQDDFVRNALGFDEDAAPALVRRVPVDAVAPIEVIETVEALAVGAAPAGASERSDAVEALIRQQVDDSALPVPCARLAAQILQLDPALAADWNGKGVFRKYVESLAVDPVLFHWNGSGGFAYDPARHSPGADAKADAQHEDWGDAAELLPVARQVHEVTGVPLLSPARYRSLFATIEADVATHPFHLMETGKRVRDLCREGGFPVSRADVNQVLRGMLMRGHAFDAGRSDAATLARKLADNIRSLCLREQMLLDAATDRAIRIWIVGSE